MKARIFYIFAVWIAAAALTFGQGQSCGTGSYCSGPETAQNDAVTLPLAQGSASAVINLSGTFTATLTFEGGVNTPDGGIVWTAATGTPVAGGTAVTTATATGQWRFVVSGFTSFRARCSAYTSGRIYATISASQGSAASGGSGGSGTGFPVTTSVHVQSGGTITVDSGGTLTCAAGSTCPSGANTALSNLVSPVPNASFVFAPGLSVGSSDTGSPAMTFGTNSISFNQPISNTNSVLTTPNLGTPSAINLTHATALPCAALPALTGDATTSAGTCATSVVQVNGATVPTSSAFLGSNSSGQLVSVAGVGGYTSALSYTPVAAQWVNDAVMTNGSSTVTSATAAFCNGTTVPCSGTFPSGSTRTTDVGALVWGMNGLLSGTLWLPQGTITAVNSATSITVSTTGNASASGTTNGLLAWGPDESTGVGNAYTATKCGGLAFPPGGAIVQSVQFVTIPSCNNATTYRATTIVGTGPSTSFIIPSPSFVLSGCTGGFSGKSCFGSAGITWQNIAIWGTGFSPTGTHNVVGLEISNSRAAYVNAEGWMANTTSATGIELYGDQALLLSGGSISFGITGLLAGTVQTFSQGNYVTGYPAVSIPAGTGMVSVNNYYTGGNSSNVVSVAGIYQDFSDFVNPNAGSSAVQVSNAAGKAYINGGIIMITPALGSTGLYLSTSGASAYLSNVKIQGGTSAGTTLNAVSGANIYDLGGNTFVAGGSSNVLSGNVFNDQSITGTVQTAANINLNSTATTGWGVAAGAGTGVSVVTGATKFEGFTATAAGVPSVSPTITVTFPTGTNVFLTTPVCSIALVGGTGTGITAPLLPTSISATAVTWTFTGTAIATGTYIFQQRCDNPNI